MPAWAEKNATNCLDVFRWNPVQFIAKVQIDNAVTKALLDTGRHSSIVDLESAQKLGLQVTPAGRDSRFRHCHSPGYPPWPYAGLVYRPLPL